MAEVREENRQNSKKKRRAGRFERFFLKCRRYLLEAYPVLIPVTLVIFLLLSELVGLAITSFLNFGAKGAKYWPIIYGLTNPIPYLITAAGVILFIYARVSMDPVKADKYRNFTYSDSDVAGACRWMSDDDKLEKLNYCRLEDTTDDILGFDIDDEGIMKDTVLTVREDVIFPNHHRLICGGSGARKTTTHLMNHALQAVRRGESIILTDPKGELYSMLKHVCESRGYDVKQFNLQHPGNSDAIDLLRELMPVQYDDNYETDLMTNCQILAQTIMQNTSDPNAKGNGPGNFWYDTSNNILQAEFFKLAKTSGHMTFNDMYMDLQKDSAAFGALFSSLPVTSPAKAAMAGYLDYLGNGKGDLCAQILNGLRTRLQIFNNQAFRSIISNPEIDLKKPGFEKCAYFIILPDQHHTMDFVASMFFSLIFNRLVAASEPVPGRKLPKRVNFLMDEFFSSGRIPDFDNKLATVRSRNISITMVIQNIAQLEIRYPNKAWEGIIGNCDENVYIGGSDIESSADYYEKRLGQATAESEGERHSRRMADPFGDRFHPQRMISTSLTARSLMTAAEIIQSLSLDHNLVFLKQSPPLLTGKVDYHNNPLAKEIVEFEAIHHTPAWARREKGYPMDMPDEELYPLIVEANKRKQMGYYPSPDSQFASFEEFLTAYREGSLIPVPEDEEESLKHGIQPAPAYTVSEEIKENLTAPKKRGKLVFSGKGGEEKEKTPPVSEEESSDSAKRKEVRSEEEVLKTAERKEENRVVQEESIKPEEPEKPLATAESVTEKKTVSAKELSRKLSVKRKKQSGITDF